MNMCNGRYSLYLENHGERHVFDFGSKDFCVTLGSAMGKVSLATIDSLTTSFQSGADLCNYLEKSIGSNLESSRKIYIAYQSPATKMEKRLGAIFNDPVLHNIANQVVGNKVNFQDEETAQVFDDIWAEFGSNSSFLPSVLEATDPTVCLNEYNKTLLDMALKSSSGYSSNIRDSFASYREYRALYIAYARSKKIKEQRRDSVLAKKIKNLK